MQLANVGPFLTFSVIFGFYLGPVRSDQIIILLFGILSFLNLIRSKQGLKIREISAVFLIVFFIILGLISFLFAQNRPITLLVISQLENYVSVLLIYFIWLFYFKNTNLSQTIALQKIFIFAMCGVTFLNLCSWAFGHQILSIFHIAKIGNERPEIAGMTLLELTQSSGRYPGTFGQIFEAGIAYFLALLSVLSVRKYFSTNSFWIYAFALVMVGGLLSGSKVFIVCGLLIMLNQFYKWSVILFLLLILFGVTCLITLLLMDIQLPWQFNRLITNVTWNNILNIYTSDRFAEGSLILSGITNIYQQSPVIGMGFGFNANSDFSLYEVMAISGILGVVVYISIIILIYTDLSSERDALRSIYIIAFIAAISLSAPAITANKISFLLPVFLLSLKKVWKSS